MEHAARLLEAHAAGDAERVVALITAAPLESWFGVPPDRMREIVGDLPPHLIPANSALRAFRLFLYGPVTREPTDDVDLSDEAARYFDARARGQARDALDQARRGSQSSRANALFDETAGMATFQALQVGVTEMLSGDLADALDSFTLAGRATPPVELTALLRDAYVKPALVHALYGDPRTAQRNLDLAGALPRTGSWVEFVIDAHAQLAAAAIVDDAHLAAAIEAVERIPVPLLGELWPYRVEVLFRLQLRRGSLDEAAAGVERFRPAAAGFVPGRGLPGSVFAATSATAALFRGDLGRARALLAEADERPVPYQLLRASVALVSGDDEGIIPRLVGMHNHTRHLRQMEFSRLSLLSAALLARGDSDGAAGLLRELADRPGGFHDAERVFVLPSVAQFAAAAVPGWPEGFSSAQLVVREGAVALTAREREVLTLLASEMTRTQIAQALFVSVNTVKSQQRAVFRKLGVATRVDAVLAAQRLGIL